jgi:hypothetical protein
VTQARPRLDGVCGLGPGHSTMSRSARRPAFPYRPSRARPPVVCRRARDAAPVDRSDQLYDPIGLNLASRSTTDGHAKRAGGGSCDARAVARRYRYRLAATGGSSRHVRGQDRRQLHCSRVRRTSPVSLQRIVESSGLAGKERPSGSARFATVVSETHNLATRLQVLATRPAW